MPLQWLVKARARRAPVVRRIDPHRQRARAQPEVLSVDIPRGKFSVITGVSRLGQEHAGLRHPVQRGPAALPRIAERLCAQHRAAGRPARGRCGLRHPADGGHRAAPVARRAQEHGGHDHRGLALPAPAVGQARPAALRARRRAGAAAERREHRRAAAARPPRPARRACWRRWWWPQGRLHRPRQVGQGARPHAPARRRRVPQARPLAAARPLQGAHARAAGGRHRDHARQRGRAARAAGQGARARQGRDAPAASAGRPGRGDGRRRSRRRRIGAVKVFSTKRACPTCGTSYPELDPRMFSLQQQARLVHAPASAPAWR